MEKIKPSRLDPIVNCRVYDGFITQNADMTVQTRFKIGEVAKQSGVAVGALRYYEGLGLLCSERGENGYRYYTTQTIQLVQFIKKAQSLGFSLEDIHEVLSIHHNGNEPCDFVRSRLQDKISQLETQIQQMIAFKHDLEAYRDRWNEPATSPQPHDICPLIESIPLPPDS